MSKFGDFMTMIMGIIAIVFAIGFWVSGNPVTAVLAIIFVILCAMCVKGFPNDRIRR